MLNKRILLAGLLACLCGGVTLPSARAQEKKVFYNKSVFKNYKSLPANKQAVAATIKRVKDAFPGWAVVTDKVDGSFIDIYGRSVALPGTTNADKAQQCLEQTLTTLGLHSADWVQGKVVTGPTADYVNYTRKINGHAVVFSNLTFRFNKKGELARIQMQHYGAPVLNAPALAVADAAAAAEHDLQEYADITITHTDIVPGWSWFPMPVINGYELRPAYSFTVSGKERSGLPLKLSGYIDAVNGKVLYRANQVKETAYDLTVKGTVYKAGITNPATLEPLENLELQIGLATFYTDTAGKYSDAALSLPLSTTIPLQGKWSVVYDDPTGLTPVFTNVVSLPGTTYTYPTTTPASSRHINAYYHVNRIHRYMNEHLPGFTDLDFALPTNVDLNSGTCNAYYTGSDINFFAAGGGCNSFADMGDVVYHEYGHGISDMFYTWISGTTLMNGALHEGNSDIWGLGITKYPILAENAFTSGGYIRRYDIIPQVYPIDCDGLDPHKDGMIIAGAWWDVGISIGNVDTMMKIFASVYYDHPNFPDGMEGPLYQEILIDAILNDDNDGNPFNGTPHYAALVTGFARHGIYVLGDAVLTHTELSDQPANAPITVNAILGASSYNYFHDITMYYRVNNAGSWTSVVLDPITSSGSIPAQDAGTTVEYYFIVHDSIGQACAYFPLACNPTLPAEWSNTPYQFAVGVAAIDSANFDGATTGWNIANNAGDNAVAGKWVQASPFATYNIWPFGDHTGLGSCLATGDEVDTSGIYRGTSTVISPVFDISAFSTPVVSYYRWISNEKGYRNVKNDPWVVKMRDASNNTWKTVENTYQGELEWRRRVFPVSAYLPAGTASIQLKFFASDSVITALRSGGQSINVNCLDDVYIYDKSAVGVKDNAQAKARIFPIPADNQVQVVLPVGNAGTIQLYNITGQLVFETAMQQGISRYTIGTATLPAGQYNIVIQGGSFIQSRKIVVLHQQ